MSEYFLGVDLGGTKTALGLVDGQGIRFMDQFPTLASRGPGDWLQRLRESALQLLPAGGRILGAGMAVPGVLSRDSGMVVNAFNLPRFMGAPLRDMAEAALGFPVAMGNDANLYALGEYHFGDAGPSESFACLTLGTGVGGGLVFKGRLVSGGVAAGELGHIVVEPEGLLCPCGVRGCVEAYAAIGGLRNILQQFLAQGRQSVLKSTDSPEDIARAADGGDQVAREVFALAGKMLGRVIATLACTVGVDTVVFGGGLSGAWRHLKDNIRPELNLRLKMCDPAGIRIMKANLGGKAPILGAAALIKEQMNLD